MKGITFLSGRSPRCLLWVVLSLSYLPAALRAQDDLANQASSLMQAGNFREAEALWRQLEQRYPKNPTFPGNLGVSLAQQEQFASAAAEYRKSLALSPKQPDVAFNLGAAEFKQGHFNQAIAAFKTAARLKPDDHRTTLLIGMSYYGLREYPAATPYLQEASVSAPSNLELHSVLAQSCLWSQRYECALAEFKSILSVNPDAVQAHMLLAEALDGMDKTSEAITELQEAEHLAPNEPVLHFELGYLYYRQHDFDRAKPEFELEIKNNAIYAQSYLYLGDIALHTNDSASAERLLKKALELQKESRLAYFDLGSIYADQGRNQEALVALGVPGEFCASERHKKLA
jgi:Flp pilus assembly protein TadD